MLKDYVLGAEVAQKGNFNIANISMLLKDFGLVEGIDYLKFGGITLLNRKSLVIPNYIEKLMLDESMTDLSPYIPYTYFSEELNGHLSMIKDKFTKLKIDGKQFVHIKDKELNEVMMNERLVKSVVHNDEIKELVNENYIKGYIKISAQKSLCWY